MTTSNIDISSYHGKINDLDSHLMLPLRSYPVVMGKTGAAIYEGIKASLSGSPMLSLLDPEEDEVDATPESIWTQKGPTAPGASSLKMRLQVNDMMGINRQLVFPPVPVCFVAWGRSDISLDAMRTYNDFCIDWASDSNGRLRPIGLLNIHDLDIACSEAERAIKRGARAFVIPDGTPPGGFSPAAQELDRLWAILADADAPALVHVGGGAGYIRHHTWGNAELLKTGGAGAGEIVTPHMLATHHQGPENYLVALVLGGVFERHPKLRFGAIEYGAAWVGPIADRMDMIFKMGFARQAREYCSLMPSEYLSRNFRVTPYINEDIGAMIDRYGLEDIYCFSTDFPHPEGGKNPIDRMSDSLFSHGESIISKFLVTNPELLVPA